MNVLQVVTTRRPFFECQVRALENHGITNEIVALPGDPGERSPIEYLQVYPHVLRKSFSDFDIIHANYGTVSPLALFQPKRPVVLTLWGSDLMGKRGKLSQRFARYCDEVIVMSEEMERELSRDAHVIPHGVNLERFRPIPKVDAQQRIGWNSDERHVLFPYDPDRDVKNFPLAKAIVERVHRVMGTVNLQVLHGVNHDEVPLYMNAADSLLLTSHREGSPNTVKEAMACNVPVVSTDVGDVDGLLEDVTPSCVYETEEQLEQALSKILQQQSRSNGRDIIRKKGLSLAQMGEKIKIVYEQATQ